MCGVLKVDTPIIENLLFGFAVLLTEFGLIIGNYSGV
jgi:hypothetical protein